MHQAFWYISQLPNFTFFLRTWTQDNYFLILFIKFTYSPLEFKSRKIHHHLISIGNSMICRHDPLGEWNLRQFWNITSGIYARYQVQIMLLLVYTTTHKRFVIFTCRYFKLSWNTTALSQSDCRNFSCCSINWMTWHKSDQFWNGVNSLFGRRHSPPPSPLSLLNIPISYLCFEDRGRLSRVKSATQSFSYTLLDDWFRASPRYSPLWLV